MTATVVIGRIPGMADDDIIPEFGDLTGLTRLYWLAVQRSRASDLPDDGKAVILGEFEAQFRAVRAASTRSPRCA